MRLPTSVRALANRCNARRTRVALATLAIVVALPSAAWSVGPTNVSGTISSNTTWTLANSPYVMTGNVTVASGVTLTIEPGVVVQGNATTRQLRVDGSLSAVGTSSSRITFTSTSGSAPGQWLGIYFPTVAGTSTLAFADVRYGGGGGASHANGMVDVVGGTVTIEDSTFTDSSVSGLKVSGGTTGSAATVTIRRSKFERNGFGTSPHGNGLYSLNGNLVVEDSAFWGNERDGINYNVGGSYAQTPARISGSSIWGNGRYGVYLFQDPGAEALAPDGNVAGKPGNAIYDNGTFGLSVSEKWTQLSVSRDSSAVDWRGAYWGPVTFVPCLLGSQHGLLSYGAPDPNPTTSLPVPRGPVSHTLAASGGAWCGNDDVLVNEPANAMPDLYFDGPASIFGGIALDQTKGCSCEEGGQLATSVDRRDGLRHTGRPVNTASGSLVEVATDLQLPGPGAPFAWTRTYNSQDTASGALGIGWTHPFGARITVVNATTGELEYLSGSGQRTRFLKTSGGATGAATYAGKAFDGTLKRLTGGSYELVTRDRRTFSFDSAGLLTQIKPRFLPATTLAYTSGKLSSITDSGGRTISISSAWVL